MTSRTTVNEENQVSNVTSDAGRTKSSRGGTSSHGSTKRTTELTILTRKARMRLNNKGRSYPGSSSRGKNRRNILKRNVYKAVPSIATIHKQSWIVHEGQYYQLGDIVALEDVEGGYYFAQIRGFLDDQYNQKSCVITWLIPTNASPTDSFDPRTFIIGPDEDRPRLMDSVSFVCHCPSDYFRVENGPYPTLPDTRNPEQKAGFIMTRFGYEEGNLPISRDDLYGPASLSASDTDEISAVRELEKNDIKEEKEDVIEDDDDDERG